MSRIPTLKPVSYYGSGSQQVSGPEKGAAPIRRCTLSPDELVSRPFDGLDTVHDILQYAARTHGSRQAMGQRDVVNIIEEEKDVTKMVDGKEVTEKKKWKYFQLSEYKYMSYLEVQEAVSELSRGLFELGISSNNVINVYAKTSINWQLMSFACASLAIPIATAYDTLGPEGLKHSLNEPECVGLFTNAELLPTLKKVLSETPTVKFIFYDGEPSNGVLDQIRDGHDNIRVLSLTELRELGKDKPTEPLESKRPKKEDLACIMYTSGSTGNPKGVTIKHSNLLASIAAVNLLLGHHLNYDDRYLAYLPLAHVLEYIVELCMVFAGMPLGFGGVKTLTDASVRNCKGDLAECQPTIIVGVPMIWETIRKAMLSKVNAAGFVKKNLFHAAMYLKKAKVPVLAQLADTIVLSSARAATGGKLRIALSGGAAISRDTQIFLSTALVTVIQGYGMTESCGMCAILPPEMMRTDAVGVPVPSIEIKLLDHVDAGYLSSNDPPQGEVAIRGPSVTSGYYKRPDLNDDETVFTKDGWMRTGDIGQWNSDGTLSVIDRVKNLIKLQTGEYIALERLESVYKSCNLIGNLCVHASQEAKQPIGIIIPQEAHLRHTLQGSAAATAKTNGVDASASLADLCNNKYVQELIRKECNDIGKKNGFKGQELLQAVVLTADEWTSENGFLTAAQKIQRSKIAKAFEAQIKDVYKNQ